VRLREDGSAVTGIQVEITTEIDDFRKFKTPTDADGTYRFEWNSSVFLVSLRACAGSETAASERGLRSHLPAGGRREVDSSRMRRSSSRERMDHSSGGPRSVRSPTGST